MWGLQLAFLNPALALLLVTLFDATPGEVGGVLAVYNASGFVASLVLPAYADRKAEYLRPMLACAVLTLALVVLLAVSTSLPLAVIGLVVLGGPAGVGSALLFAHLKHSGAEPADVVNTRAIMSFAWAAGPPLAALIIGAFGERALLAVIAAVAVLMIAATAAMLAERTTAGVEQPGPGEAATADTPMPRAVVALIVAAFVALQATNYTVVAIMGVFVTQTLELNVIWAGVALGVAAALEVPFLLLSGRLSRRHSSLTLVAAGSLVGVAFYVGMAAVSGTVLLIGLQVLNACFFAAVAGVGLTLFQEIIARPGMASGLYMNARRVGAIVAGPLISFGSLTALGYRGTFVACAVLTVAALAAIVIAARASSTANLSSMPA